MRARSDLPVELIQSVGDDSMTACAARVSTGHDLVAVNPDSDAGLIKYLMKNRHGSPFEHGSMTFRIECPIFVAREFMRHRTGWSYNEESGRYKEMRDEFYVPPAGRPLRQVGKPGAYSFEPGTFHQHAQMEREFTELYEHAWDAYEQLLKADIAKEVARMVLPVGVYTSFYATCNPRSLMHFLSLRTKSIHAAYPSYPMHEIAEVAAGMEYQFMLLYPETHAAWVSNGRVSP